MKNLALLTLILSSPLWSQSTPEEEAILLNQEMQFLEDSAKNVTAAPVRTEDVPSAMISDTPRRSRTSEENLERTYFGEEELDSVQTRTAAPKRRMLR